MECTFQKGDMVICLHDNWDVNAKKWLEITINRPIAGDVYTIDEIFPPDSINNLIGVTLKEIQNEIFDFGVDGVSQPRFDYKCFRPVKKTNIDIFKKIAIKPSLDPIMESKYEMRKLGMLEPVK